MISISRAWYHPLEHLVRAVAALKGACETMLSKVKEVEKKNEELLEEMKKILVRVSVLSLSLSFLFPFFHEKGILL